MANVRAIGQVWRLPVYWPSGNRYLGGMNKEGRGTPQGGVISPLLAICSYTMLLICGSQSFTQE